MKVILLKDVAGVGQRNAIKDVADGYALNYLLPRGLARQGTKEAVATVEKRVAEERQSIKLHQEKMEAALKQLDGQKLIIHAKANERGNLFKSVKKDDIATAIFDSANVILDPRTIELGVQAIKHTGEYAIHVAGEGIEASITLVIDAAGSASRSRKLIQTGLL